MASAGGSALYRFPIKRIDQVPVVAREALPRQSLHGGIDTVLGEKRFQQATGIVPRRVIAFPDPPANLFVDDGAN